MSNPRGQPAVGHAGDTESEYTARARPYQGYGTESYYADSGESTGAAAGTVLAGILMMLGGAWDFLAGIAVLIKKSFFVHVSGTYAYHWNVTSWGWTHIALGAVVFAAGICVLMGMTWARIVGIVLASLNTIAAFLFLPYYPFWSILIIAISVYIIWALSSAGHRRRPVRY